MTQIKDASLTEGVEPDYQLPDLDEAQYLLDMALQVGLAKSHSGSVISLEWIDIKAWQELTGNELCASEAEALKSLSGAYVSQYYESLESGCVSPHQTAPQNREVVEGKLKALFSMLKGNK